MSAPPAIEAVGICKQYPPARLLSMFSRKGTRTGEALSDVSFCVYPGEMVGLLGPNGAGKTTLLKIASTMLYPSSGTMRIGGCAIDEHPIEVRRRIGLITSDERSFYWRLTGRQNLEFFAALWDVPSHLASRRISELLELLSLAHAADQPFFAYSSGMKQKMAIARGLLADPSIVLYDEPTRALDPLSTRNIRGWLRSHRLATPHTAHLIATNQMDEAEQLCDRLIVLNRGRIVASGSIEEIRGRLQGHLVHRLICRGLNARLPRPDPAAGLLAVTTPEADGKTIEVHTAPGSAGLSLAIEQILLQGGQILGCEHIQMTLEGIICSIVENDPRPASAVEVTLP